MSPSLPVTPDDDRRAGRRRGRGGRGDHPPARPRSGDRPAEPRARALPGGDRGRCASRPTPILNISTGGSSDMTVDQRLAPARHWAPELASLNMGSMNFVFAGAAPARRAVGSTRGRSRTCSAPRTGSSRTRSRRSSRRWRSSARRARASSSSATTSATSTRSRTSPSAGWCSRRSGPDDLRHPRRHRRPPGEPRPHGADRRPPVRHRLRPVGLRGGPPPDGLHHRLGAARRARAGRARGQPDDRPRRRSRPTTRSR